MKKCILCLLMTLCLLLPAELSMAATADASIVPAQTVKLTAPFSGTLLPFDVETGERVSAEQTLFELSTAPVYAPIAGTVAVVFATTGADAAGVIALYGALARIEPEHPLYVQADTSMAYDKDENRYVHAGESLYLKCGDEKGMGLVTGVSDANFTVQILSGNYALNDTVRCYRESNHDRESEVGRGKVKRYDDALVTASGRVMRSHAIPGQHVSAGDLLFETVDSLAKPSEKSTVNAPVDGVVTALAVTPGAQVYRGQLLCELADLSALELSAEVDEMDVRTVHVGDPLTYTLDAFGEETFTGTVTQIRAVGTKKQNASYFDVRISVPTDKAFLPGMNGTLTLN